MRSMRLLQINQGIDPDDDDEEPLDNEFKDVSLHLYRKTVPDFDERRKNLEQKLVVRVFSQVVWFSVTSGCTH